MKLIFLIALQCYFALFSRETNEALRFIEKNATVIRKNLSGLSPEERLMAMAIVAPEISQYSSVSNFMEMRALFISYRNFGRGDFSVGHFQMKPSFIEDLEKEIRSDKQLSGRYKQNLPSGSDIEKRETRLERLASLEWQLKYLQVFIDVVKIKTRNLKFKSAEEKLKYWATLYNSGFHSNQQRVASMQKKNYFPRGSKKFNYSDVALEFYTELSKKRSLFQN